MPRNKINETCCFKQKTNSSGSSITRWIFFIWIVEQEKINDKSHFFRTSCSAKRIFNVFCVNFVNSSCRSIRNSKFSIERKYLSKNCFRRSSGDVFFCENSSINFIKFSSTRFSIWSSSFDSSESSNVCWKLSTKIDSICFSFRLSKKKPTENRHQKIQKNKIHHENVNQTEN